MSILSDLFWWFRPEGNTDPLPTGTLTSEQQAFVLARADNLCQHNYPGCTLTATTIELAYQPDKLAWLRRHPDNPDSWQATCTNCAGHYYEPGS